MVTPTDFLLLSVILVPDSDGAEAYISFTSFDACRHPKVNNILILQTFRKNSYFTALLGILLQSWTELRWEDQCHRSSEEATKDEQSLSAQGDRITSHSCLSLPLGWGTSWCLSRRPRCNGRMDDVGEGNYISAVLPMETRGCSAWLRDTPIPPAVCLWLQIYSSSQDKGQ